MPQNALALLRNSICWESSAGLDHAHHHLHRGSAADRPAARCRAPSSTMPRPAPIRRRRCAPIAHDLERIKLRQRVLVDVSQARPHHHHPRREGCAAARARADRALRHAARRRRDPRLPRGAGGRHSVHALHHVDLLDRGRGARRSSKPFWFQLYVMRDRGFIKRADRARRGGEVQRAGAHASTCRCSASAIATSATA